MCLQSRRSVFNPWKDLLEKEMATHFSILTEEIPWTEEPERWHPKESDTTYQQNHCHHHHSWVNIMVPIMGCQGGGSGQKPTCQCMKLRPRFISWVRKIPWRRAWPSTPVSVPGESHGQRSLVGYSPLVAKLRRFSTHTQFLIILKLVKLHHQVIITT